MLQSLLRFVLPIVKAVLCLAPLALWSGQTRASLDNCILAYLPCSFMVFFEPGSAALSVNALRTLNQFVSNCTEAYDGKIVVTGHSDENGTKQAKEAISQARAEAVRDYLRSTGIKPQSIEIRVLGDSKPLMNRRMGDTKQNEEADQTNRRVELNVVK
ncbi:hypothetical protein BH11PSE3_BH11PSE3_39290 [soil metagenome]